MRAYLRLPSIRAVVGAIRTGEHVAVGTDALEKRLLDVYRPLLGEATCVRTIEVPATRTVVAAVADTDIPPLRTGDRLVWGVPVGHDGEASDEEIEAILRRPEAARDLLGVYVLASIDPKIVRLVSSACLSKTLRRVDGPRGSAFVTRAMAGHVLAGGDLGMSEAAGFDFVLYEFPMGADELLTGTAVLEEASVVDLAEDGMSCRSYWARRERVEPGVPTTAEGLRDVVADTTSRLARVSGTRFALTAGRDSTLLAASLGSSGRHADAFTLGTEDFSDAVGAAHTAKTLGWSHRAVPIGVAHPDDRFAEVVRWAPWHEGLQRAWDYAASWIEWDARDLFYVGGHGGEIGRSFYGPLLRGSDDALDALSRRASQLPTEAYETVRERVARVLDQVRTLGRPDIDTLDLVYAFYRAHHLFVRFPPFAQFRAFATPYLEPRVVSALLDIPVDRRDGSLFEEALASACPGLIPSAVERSSVWAAWTRNETRRWGRLRRRLRRDPGWRSLRVALDHANGAPYIRDLLGRAWFDRTRQRARDGHAYSFWRLWNALTVEALHVYLRSQQTHPAAAASAAAVHRPSTEPVVN